jgi:hypothetical protein
VAKASKYIRSYVPGVLDHLLPVYMALVVGVPISECTKLYGYKGKQSIGWLRRRYADAINGFRDGEPVYLHGIVRYALACTLWSCVDPDRAGQARTIGGIATAIRHLASLAEATKPPRAAPKPVTPGRAAGDAALRTLDRLSHGPGAPTTGSVPGDDSPDNTDDTQIS